MNREPQALTPSFPLLRIPWVPACAGMTVAWGKVPSYAYPRFSLATPTVVPAQAGTQKGAG